MAIRTILGRSIRAVGIFFFLIGIIIVGSVEAQEPGTETLISVTTPEIAQYSPAISGDNIVWGDGINGYLRYYNLITGNESVIQNDTYLYEAPAISGNIVVSQAFGTDYDIFLFHISTGEGFILTPDSTNSDDFAPAVSGQYVAWKSYDYDGGTCNVLLYDLDAQLTPPELIASNTASCGCTIGDMNCLDPQIYPSPSISATYLVYDALVDSQYDIFLYNISDKTTINLSADAPDSDQEYPVISDDYVVWQDNRNGNWDIFMADISNLSNITISPLTSDPASQIFPAIDGTYVVWRDEGTESIMLYDILSKSTVQITPPLRQPYDPAISTNRIVYTGDTPDTKIYMFTYGVSVDCPVANFTNSTPRTAIVAPHSVQFIDTSTPTPDVTIWNFGDGKPSSRDANPEHTYESVGTYDVSLISSTPCCRSMLIKNDFVSIGEEPVVDFTASPTCGVMPLSVSFADRSSGTPTEWSWDFNNDGVSDSIAQNPLFVYARGGSYSVNLSATNALGEKSLLKQEYISVMNRSETVLDAAIDGLSIIGTVHSVFNTTKIPDYSLNGTSLSFIPLPGNGIKEITLISDEEGFSVEGDTIEGNLTRVFIASESIPLEGFSEGVGPEAYVNFTLEMPAYPVAGTMTPYLFENAVPCDEHDLNKISYDSGFSELSRTAYEIRFIKENFGTITNMSLNLSVNSSWVLDRSKVWVIRIGDDGTGEVLPTQFVGEDTIHQLDIFSAYSPRGASRFALTTLSQAGNPLQIIVLIVQQLFGGISGSDNDACTPVCTWEKDGSTYSSCNPADCPKGASVVSISSGTSSPTPTPSPMVTPPPEITGTLTLPTTDDGIVDESFEVQAEDHKGMLSIFKGTRALNADGSPLSEISIRPLDASEIASLPAGESFQGIAYELLPDGATFDTPLVFTLEIPGEVWNSSRRYSLQWHNRTAGRWEAISTTSIPDTHTLIAHIEHFSVIGLFGYDLPANTTTSGTPPPVPPVTTTPLSTCICILAVGIGVVWWIRGRR